MSSVTFGIINKGKIKYCVAHYSVIKDILEGEEDIERLSSINISDLRYSDTFLIPIVILDFDKKVLINTDYNWFDNFEQYLPEDWTYKRFKVVGV